MNILITGSNSSLSLNFQKYIKKKFNGEAILFGTNRTGESQKGFKKIYKIDFRSSNFEKISETFDYVIHVASAVPSKCHERELFRQVNVVGPISFFKQLKLKDNAKILNISSMSVYQRSMEEFLSEESEKSKSDEYGLSKLCFEEEISELYADSDISILSVRVPCLLVANIQGNFIAKMKEKILNNEQVQLSNINSPFNAAVDGNSLIEFVLDFKYNSIRENFNVASQKNMTILEMAKCIAQSAGKSLIYTEVATDFPSQILKTEKAERYGFNPPNLQNVLMKFTNY